MDVLSLAWEGLNLYAILPVALLGKVALQDPGSKLPEVVLNSSRLAQHAVVLGPGDVAILDPLAPSSTTQPADSAIQWEHTQRSFIPEPIHLVPRVWSIKGSLTKWQQELRHLKEAQPELSMKQSGPFLSDDVSLIMWI